MTPLAEELLLAVVKIVVVVGALLLGFSVMTWVERRTLAFMQYRLGPNRTGPFGILQPIADGIKLFFKEEVMPAAANKGAKIASIAKVWRCVAAVRRPRVAIASTSSARGRRPAATMVTMAAR